MRFKGFHKILSPIMHITVAVCLLKLFHAAQILTEDNYAFSGTIYTCNFMKLDNIALVPALLVFSLQKRP